MHDSDLLALATHNEEVWRMLTFSVMRGEGRVHVDDDNLREATWGWQ